MSSGDFIENIIGPFGRYQTWILLLILISRMPTDNQLNNIVFIMPKVTFNCTSPEEVNLPNHCPCSNPLYDRSVVKSSVTSEFNLICERAPLGSFAQSILHGGVLLGSFLFGHISDRYGRRIAIVSATFLEASIVAVSAFVPYFWMFLVCRFIIGVGVGGSLLCCYVLLIEITGKSFRPYVIGLNETSYILSYFILPVIAYFVRDWRNLQLATSVPWLIVITFYWLLPESPRWLITVNRKEEAKDTLRFIAKRNGRPKLAVDAALKDSIFNQEDQMDKKKDKKLLVSYLQLFRTSKMRFYTITVSILWLCCSHAYFGISQYIGNLQGNLYLNVMFTGLCYIPNIILTCIASIYFKRKPTVIVTFAIAAICLVLYLIIPTKLFFVRQFFVTASLSFIYGAFVLLYLYTSEVFPTVVRNSALGFASMFARLGSFIAPFVVNIKIEWISIVIFTALLFFAAGLCWLLPETKDTVLLNTIDQVERKESETSM